MKKIPTFSILLMIILAVSVIAASLDGYKNANWATSLEKVQEALKIKLESYEYDGNMPFYLDVLFMDMLGVPIEEESKNDKHYPPKYEPNIFPENDVENYQVGGEDYYDSWDNDQCCFYKKRFFMYGIKLKEKRLSYYSQKLKRLHGNPKQRIVRYGTTLDPPIEFNIHSWKSGTTLIWLIDRKICQYTTISEMLSTKDICEDSPNEPHDLYLIYTSADLYSELRQDIETRIAKKRAKEKEKRKKRLQGEQGKIQ